MIFSPEPGPTLMLVAHAPGSKQRQTKRRSRMKENHIGSRRSQLDQGLVVLCVQGEINRALTGHGGYQYESPAQARQQAPTLARVLLGYTNGTLHGWDQWSCPIAGGRRTVRLKPQPRREGLRQSTR
jgi:hypothetical protein